MRRGLIWNLVEIAASSFAVFRLGWKAQCPRSDSQTSDRQIHIQPLLYHSGLYQRDYLLRGGYAAGPGAVVI